MQPTVPYKILFFASLLYLFLVSSKAAYSSENADNDAYIFDTIYTGEYWSNRKGGIRQDEAYLDIIDISLEVDAEKAFSWENGTFFAYVFATNNALFSGPIVGDAQTVSNIDNSKVHRVMELWYEQGFANKRSLKFGLMDLNTEFDAIEHAALFINSSHGMGADFAQSGENGPSTFPVPSLALRFYQPISENFSYRIAVFDGVPGDPDLPKRNTIQLGKGDGELFTFETNYRTDFQRYGIGTWFYSDRTTTLDGLSEEHNHGVYMMLENTLPDLGKKGSLLGMWLRYGLADEAINQFSRYIGGGLVYKHFSTSRPNDSIGFAIATAINGNDFRQAATLKGFNSDSKEVNFELTYQAVINERITLQPDIQYIINPGTDASLDDAFVVGLRFEITLF